MSCAHRRRVAGDVTTLLEATHWERGLQLHRQSLAQPRAVSTHEDQDAVLATTFLQIMYTFALNDQVPITAVSSGSNEYLRFLAPLAATGGFRGLFQIYQELNPDSKWGPVLDSTEDAAGTFTYPSPGTSGLPKAFVRLCGLDENSTSDTSPYHRIVRLLTPVLKLPPAEENFATLFAFLGRTWPDFKPLLLKKDPIALLLLSYWLALLRQVDQWWLRTRAKTACAAVVAYLQCSESAEIRALLPFPAAFDEADAAHMWRLLRYVLEDSV